MNDQLPFSPALLTQLHGPLERSGCALQLPGGPRLGHQEARAVLVVTELDAVVAAMASPSYQALGEAYLGGALEVEGDFEAACAFADELRAALGLAEADEPDPSAVVPGLDSAFEGRGDSHSPARDAEAIAYHYDLSNRVFALITDETMTYSCAYYRGPEDGLAAAQRRKLDRTCRKLELEPGERLLDIGCGWGGMLIHAAREYGVEGVGVTISAAQAEEARARIAAAGLADKLEVRLCDYREIAKEPAFAAGFDKIVSLGMVEHVGVAKLPTYFEVALGALRPGGRFLMQGVTSARHMPRTEALDWAQRYIFPDAELPYLSQYVEAATRVGFELRDAECMREHYGLTHRQWRLNLEAARELVVAEVGEERYRAMRAMFGFSTYHLLVGRRCEVYQLLLHSPVPGQPFTWQRPL